MNRSKNLKLLALLLIIGVLFGASFHFIIMPIFGDSLLHCINLGAFFGVVSYLVTRMIHMQFDALKKTNNDLSRDIAIDKLTGAFNRRAFDNVLVNLEHADVYSMVFIDIDNFKKFNDQYGHQVGDEVLTKVAHVIQSSLRNRDRVYRYGGEEFVVILQDCNKHHALEISEKIRRNVSGLEIQSCLNVTVSLGVSTYPEDGGTVNQIVQACDSSLLLAKSLGKNRVQAFSSRILYSTSAGKGKGNSKLNCWEFKACGRQPGGENVNELGVCAASTDQSLDLIHGGKNCGRTCWVISGTYCKGTVQGTFAQKYKDCRICDFYLLVQQQEGDHFKLPAVLLSNSP